MLTGRIKNEMDDFLANTQPFTEQSFIQMFLAIIHIHDQLFSSCRRGYTAFTQMIDDKTKE